MKKLIITKSRFGTRLMKKHIVISRSRDTDRAPVVIRNIVPGPMMEAKNCTAWYMMYSSDMSL